MTKDGHSGLEIRQEIDKRVEGQLLLRVIAARAAKTPQMPPVAPIQTPL
jgi:hypothetical protein